MEKMPNKYQLALDNVFSELRNRPAILSVKLLKSSHPTLQELVDKATPCSLIVGRYFIDCKCGNRIGSKEFPNKHIVYCPQCGQAIDWSTDHE